MPAVYVTPTGTWTDNGDVDFSGPTGWKITVGSSPIRIGLLYWGSNYPVPPQYGYVRDSSKALLNGGVDVPGGATATFIMDDANDYYCEFGTGPDYNDAPLLAANTVYYFDVTPDPGVGYYTYGYYDATGLLPMSLTGFTINTAEFMGIDQNPTLAPYIFPLAYVIVQTDAGTVAVPKQWSLAPHLVRFGKETNNNLVRL